MASQGFRGRHRWPLVLALLTGAALACSTLTGGGRTAGEQAATLEVELERAQSTATIEAAQPPTGGDVVAGASVEEAFEGATDSFLLGEGARVADGALLLGPYDECANDVANFDAPVDCLVVCTACGAALSEYRMQATFTFEEGLSDREFGVILRLVDEDSDRLLDREDYLLALGFNIYENRWRVYFHEPDQIEPWREVASGKAGFLLPGRMNELEVHGVNGGRQIMVSLNGSRIIILTGDHPEPGERLVEPWVDAGAVGFLGLGRRVTGRFDDFSLEAGR